MHSKKIKGLQTIQGFPGCSHVYVLDDGKGEKLLIDAGDGTTLEHAHIKPAVVILTHAHYDHSTGVSSHWGKVFLHEKEWSKKSEVHFFPPNARKLNFKKLKWGEFELEIIHTPGHTMGSICLFEKNNDILFSGDTIFHYGIGRTDLGGSEEKMAESLKKLKKFDYHTLCPGH